MCKLGGNAEIQVFVLKRTKTFLYLSNIWDRTGLINFNIERDEKP